MSVTNTTLVDTAHSRAKRAYSDAPLTAKRGDAWIEVQDTDDPGLFDLLGQPRVEIAQDDDSTVVRLTLARTKRLRPKVAAYHAFLAELQSSGRLTSATVRTRETA